MKKILSAVLVSASLLTLTGCKKAESANLTIYRNNLTSEVERFFTVNDTARAATDFTKLFYAYDKNGEQVTITEEHLTWDKPFDISTKGEYNVTLKLTEDGKEYSSTQTVYVQENYTGELDWKYAAADVKNKGMAAAEDWLLSTVSGGVPLFSNTSYGVYSDRFTPAITDRNGYKPIVGFGAADGTFNTQKDDSTVSFVKGRVGNPGEFTYRAWNTGTPATWNPWEYKDSVSADYLTLLMDMPYRFVRQNDNTFLLQASQAKANPELLSKNDQGVYSFVSAAETAQGSIWQMPYRSDLKWADGKEMKPEHLVETFKIALKEGWYRGADVLNRSSFKVKGAEAIIKSEIKDKESAEFEALLSGLQVKVQDCVGTNQPSGTKCIIFELENVVDGWDFKYSMASFVMNPLHPKYLKSEGGSYKDDKNNSIVGLQKNFVANGVFVIESFEDKSETHMIKNTNHFDYAAKTRYPNYTGYNISVIQKSETAFDEFELGKLEYASVPTAKYDEYKTKAIWTIPGATTFRLSINSTGTQKVQDLFFKELKGSYKVNAAHALLAEDEMRLAIYAMIDREHVATNILKNRTGNKYLFSNSYAYNKKTGEAYIDTDEAKEVAKDMGYNPGLAKAYFETVVKRLVAEGRIKAKGTINLEWLSDTNESDKLVFAYLRTQANRYLTFQNAELGIDVKVNLTHRTLAFPDYYNLGSLRGTYEMGFGGISGSTLNPYGFLENFCDDNRGGLRLDAGRSTSDPEVTLEINGAQYKISFNAIVAALNGKVNVVNGREVKATA